MSSHQHREEEQDDFSIKKLFVPLTTFKAIHIIIIVGFIVYFNALFNGFVWDDIPQIVNNNLYHSIFNIVPIFLDHSFTFYRPVAAIVMAGIYTLFGTTPFWYHFIQISLHIVNAILLFIIFRRFISNIISFILSLFFLSHPMNVEAVSYISSLQIVLSMLFGLLALIITLNRRIYPIYKTFLLTLFLLCSLLSKETGIIFIILLVPFMYMSSRNLTKKEYIFSSFSVILATFFYFILRFFITNTQLVTNFSDAPVPILRATFIERLLSLPKILLFYLQTFLYPKDLAISQNWLIKTIDVNTFVIPLVFDVAFFIGIFSIAIYFTVRRKKQFKLYIFFLVWFLFSWMIHWNILIPLDMTVAERWFYFPMAGLLGIIGIISHEIVLKSKKSKQIVIGISIFVMLLLSIRTIVRNQNWHTPLTLYEHDIKISIESYDLENSYSYHLLLEKQYDNALPHIKKSIKLAPYYWVNWANLGVYYEGKGQIDRSIDAFKMAIKNNKNYYHAYISLANIYFHNKSPEEGRDYFEKSLARFPKDPQLLLLSAMTDYKLGDKQNAKNKIKKAYSINKDLNLLKVYYDIQ